MNGAKGLNRADAVTRFEAFLLPFTASSVLNAGIGPQMPALSWLTA